MARAKEPVDDPVGYSLANFGELFFGCLDASGARTVAEVGAFEGVLTRTLLEWAAPTGVQVTAIDPEPQPALRALAARHPELNLVERTSDVALAELSPQDAVIVDGDHNYYTVSGELRLIADRAADGSFPLVLLHDVGWPHGRRDIYYAPERIPEGHRQQLAADAHLDPAEPGLAESGLRYDWAAAREGGAGNGVLTAVEDFVADREGLRLAIVPAFFGLGILWDLAAPWSDAVAALVAPYDGNPLLARLEANRVGQLVAAHRAHAEVRRVHEELRRERERRGRLEGVLQAMLDSRAFAVGEQLSRFRQGGRPLFSRDQVRAALEDRPDGPR